MTDNVIEFPGRPTFSKEGPPDALKLICKLDAIRGIVAMAAKVTIEENTDDLAHAGSALFLAVDQLQELREGIEALQQ